MRLRLKYTSAAKSATPNAAIATAIQTGPPIAAACPAPTKHMAAQPTISPDTNQSEICRQTSKNRPTHPF